MTSAVALERWIKYFNAGHAAQLLSTSDGSLGAHCITQLGGFIVLLKECESPSAMSELCSKGRVFLLTKEQGVQLEHLWL